MSGFRPRAARVARAIPVFGAALLFLWTFFATEAFARAVEAARLAGAISVEQVENALRYAVAWRHGMEGGWPVYMPGFLALAAAVVPWTAGLSFRRTVVEAAGLLAAAAVVAAALAPLGSTVLLGSCRRATGLTIPDPAFALTWPAVGTGLLTAAIWISFVGLMARAAQTRRVRLLLPALLPYVALHWARPGAASNLFGELGERLGRADPAAIASLSLAALLAIVLLVPLLVRSRASARPPHPRGMG